MTTTTKQIVQFNKETENKPEFIRAKEIALYSQENQNSALNPLAHKYKGIVNEQNEKQIFNVVGTGYKIVQHDEMYDAVESTIKNLGLKAKIRTAEIGDGARLRMELTFPDIQIKIGHAEVNDVVNLRMAFDNSYNATTGMRCSVDGLRLKCTNGMKVPEGFAYFYHRHTKGLDVNSLIPTIERGVEVFQTKIKEKWDRYFQNKIDPNKARTFIQECIQDKTISVKYLEMMLRRMDFGGDIEIRGLGQITNQWMLYNLVTEVLTHECNSLDMQENFMNKMDNKIETNLKNLVMA
jgi:hypothetical protein